MRKFKSVNELVNTLKPDYPVYCIRTEEIKKSVNFFKEHFPGKILYAVKTNPHEKVIKKNPNHINALNNLGIILQGGLYNTLINRLSVLGLGNQFGNSDIPLMVLNVTHPLAPSQITDFCKGKDAVLVMEEGRPEFIEHQINTFLRKADIQTKVFGKSIFAESTEYNAAAVTRGLVDFFL